MDPGSGLEVITRYSEELVKAWKDLALKPVARGW
jgi:hypothetical protein